LVGIGVALGLPLPTGRLGDPPSSLKPKAARVLLVHEHVRVIACTNVGTDEGGRCKGQLEPASASTRITLSPVDSARGLVGDDDRTPVTVVLADEHGRAEAVVSLRPGAWVTTWSEAPTRLSVGSGDQIALRLKTTTGRCERVEAECVLHPSQRARSLQVPAANRR
jgi:hypothetical protein